jgi:hypothetical protein
MPRKEQFMHTTDPRQNQPDLPEFIYDSRISRSMRDTYTGLRSFDEGDGVWVAVETVARKLVVDRRTVMRNIRKLQVLGVLQVKAQFRGRRQKTNFYLFPTPDWWLEEAPAEGGQNAPQ